LVKWLTPRAGKGGFAVPSAPTSSSVPRRSESSGGGFRIGQTVMHPKFGLGVIVNAEGGGMDARVQVNFGNAGIKWLALSVAKLEAA
jgi:DNA helicase-2/ATP-dependent DNA helicase PcrA